MFGFAPFAAFPFGASMFIELASVDPNSEVTVELVDSSIIVDLPSRTILTIIDTDIKAILPARIGANR